MIIKESEFWKALKRLMRADDHIPVPAASVQQALNIFQPPQKEVRPSIFRFRPAFLGAVRRASGNTKKLYELDDHVVQLEQILGEGGASLTGFAHGFDDIPVTLHGQETVFQTTIDAGEFSFDDIPLGTYSLCFSQDGEASWITNIEVGPQD